ncbi:MAG TPA: hypothetical protein DEA90_05325 [Opitutae bacterium]|nr:hypothetical protein [Opitutae bacterium]
MDTDAMLVEFFNAQLGRGEVKHQGVQYFVLGKNCWQTSAHWPPNTGSIDYYLSSGGNANSSFGDGQLLPDTTTDSPSDHFTYDPEVPVSAPGGFIPVWGPVDLKAQQQGNNILVYDTAPFSSEQTIVGQPELELSVATTAEATDFVARLSWLKPDGSATFLCMAAASTNQERIGENNAYSLKLKFDATAVCIPVGDQLRLDIASSAFPLIARHPNTKADRLGLLNQSHFKRARQTVYHDTARPSRLKLPTL